MCEAVRVKRQRVPTLPGRFASKGSDLFTTDTLIIGAGQQGCATAGALSMVGHEALIVDAGEIAQSWAHDRWDSLRVNSPNKWMQLPGWKYQGPDPCGFMPSAEVAGHICRYAHAMSLDIRTHSRVIQIADSSIPSSSYRFIADVDNLGRVRARNVVVATGNDGRPTLPPISAGIDPALFQLHSVDYRSPDQLPEGAVLVVGSGTSGQQIAEELALAGRDVHLAVGSHAVVPRRYRGADFYDWILSLDDTGSLTDGARLYTSSRRSAPVLSGTHGGHDLNLNVLVENGVNVLGSVRATAGTEVLLAKNVLTIARESLADGAAWLQMIDAGIRDFGLSAPDATDRPLFDPALLPFDERNDLNLVSAGIKSIIWATGFSPSTHSFLPGTARTETGEIAHRRGTSPIPGLYYAGLSGQLSLFSGLIYGCLRVGNHLAKMIYHKTA